MVRPLNCRHPWLLAFVALTFIASALPTAAQGLGVIRGVVKDDKGQRVEGAKIIIEGGSNRDAAGGGQERLDYELTTDENGEFVQISLAAGQYKVTAITDSGRPSSDPVRELGDAVEVIITQVTPVSIDLVLAPVLPPGMTEEELVKAFELRQTIEDGVAASGAGNNEVAISKFSHAIELDPNCVECYFNLGLSEARMKDYEKSEAAYKKAIELNPDSAEAFNGLADIYNAQRKFDLAAAASAKGATLATTTAGGDGDAEALFNQGVIFWNSAKISEAKKAFEAAVQADPNHAESYYQLGMAFINEGDLPGAATKFEAYLKLAPSGPNASQAKALVAQLKQ